ncbi:MAG TPA: FHA domain-containing protein, partial [Candidatus Ozemobacteraceae bacterium]|nr:FHA domain-containing protein [Candidatus Ozemobacteraceae bacterium]
MATRAPAVTRILFIDVVGFSRKPMAIQKQVIQALTEMVQQTTAFRRLDDSQRVSLPTGDGMAIAFFGAPEIPVACAIELQKAMRRHNAAHGPELELLVRMGINSGEVFTVLDINEHRNVVGDGINNAQRVMDFGDAWHILASEAVVHDLVADNPLYESCFHDAGWFADKHGKRHHVYNLHAGDFGNPELPTRHRVETGPVAQASSPSPQPSVPAPPCAPSEPPAPVPDNAVPVSAPTPSDPHAAGEDRAATIMLNGPAVNPQVQVTLVVEQGPEQGRTFTFSEPEVFIVGRSKQAHFALSADDPAVSRKHFMLEIVPPRAYIQDFGSLNGTFVNDRRVSQQELSDRDLIKVGRTSLRVSLQTQSSAPSCKCTKCGCAYLPSEAGKDGDNSVCRACLRELELERAGRQPKTVTRVPATCCECGCDLSADANADGRAADLMPVASYLCDRCVSASAATPELRSLDEYQLLRKLGEGGMGEVHLVRHSRTRRLGALKQVIQTGASEQVTLRFKREMSIMEHLVHPRVVRLFAQDVLRHGNYFVSEFLDGGNASRLILQDYQGPVPAAIACRVLIDALSGLEFVHASGHVHRDLKPANILLAGKRSAEPGR